MEALILEGTWEELQSHEAELSGRRVRLIVIDNDQDAAGVPTGTNESSSPKERTLAEVFAGRIGNVSFDPPDLSENVEQEFGKILRQKLQDGTL